MSTYTRIALTLLACFLFQTVRAQPFTSSNLPILFINTGGQAIPVEPKITATLGVIDNGPGQRNNLADPLSGYNGNIGIELHGSSSLFYEKKNYGIELRKSDGSDTDYPMLGMPAESDWQLISPLNDKTLLRDVLAHAWARAALDWSPRTRYCEVMLNGAYIGVYALIERIKRGEDRVDIHKLSKKDTSAAALTGGYILRIDKNDDGGVGGDWSSVYPGSSFGTAPPWFQYFYPKKEDIHLKQAEYIKNYLRDFEDMMAGPDVGKEYANWLDTESWVDYLLVNELTKNIDAYRLSTYFYKDRDSVDALIKMGPVWDFNISFGIGDYCNAESPEGWVKDFNSVCPYDGWQVPFWWKTLWKEPSFRKAVVLRWLELRAGPWADDMLYGDIDSTSVALQESQVRNFQRWQVIGHYVWPNSYIGYSYGDEIRFLKNWLKNRLAWMDAQMETLYVPPPLAAGIEVYPNPAEDYVDIVMGKSSATTTTASVRFYSMSGQLLFERNAPYQFGRLHLDLPRQVLPPGVYIARVTALYEPVITVKVCIGP